MTNETLQPPSTGAAVRFPGVNDTAHPDGQGYQRRDFLKIVGLSLIHISEPTRPY